MAYTQADLEAIEAGIKSGVRAVAYDGETVTYRSLADMLRVRDMIRASLANDAAPGVGVHRSYPGVARDV